MTEPDTDKKSLIGSPAALGRLFSGGYVVQIKTARTPEQRAARRKALSERWSAVMAQVGHPVAEAIRANASRAVPRSRKVLAKVRTRRLRFLRENVGRIQSAFTPAPKPTKAKTGLRGKALQRARHDHRTAELLRRARITKAVMAAAGGGEARR